MSLTTVCVDGAIGLGKSTLIKRICADSQVVAAVFGDDTRIVAVLEPISVWEDSGAFGLMCTDPLTWAATFQHIAMATRITRWASVYKQELAKGGNVVLLLERSPMADLHVFTAQQTAEGNITAEERAEHAKWWARMWDKRPCEITRTTVLHADFETARNRIRLRARKDEDAYNWDYLEAIHRLYEQPHTWCDAHLNASAAFHTCRRALLRTVADLAGKVVADESQFQCSCGACP